MVYSKVCVLCGNRTEKLKIFFFFFLRSRNKTCDALLELKKAIDQNDNGWYAHFPIEVRFVRQSPIYLSPSYGRDSTYINIISYRPYGKHVDHTDYWNCYETIMKRYGGRPHWAKVREKSFYSFH